jgi:hypothetical protein
LTLSQSLNAPLSLFNSLLKTLSISLPPTTVSSLYRRIAMSLSSALFDRLLVNRIWSEQGGKQVKHDFEEGFMRVATTSGIRRGGAGIGWEIYKAGVLVMALGAQVEGERGVTFSKVMQVAFDDHDHGAADGEDEGAAFRTVMESLGISERVGKKEIQAVLRRRPECWR